MTHVIKLNVTVATDFPEDVASLIDTLREERVTFTFSKGHGPIEIVEVAMEDEKKERTR